MFALTLLTQIVLLSVNW